MSRHAWLLLTVLTLTGSRHLFAKIPLLLSYPEGYQGEDVLKILDLTADSIKIARSRKKNPDNEELGLHSSAPRFLISTSNGQTFRISMENTPRWLLNVLDQMIKRGPRFNQDIHSYMAPGYGVPGKITGWTALVDLDENGFPAEGLIGLKVHFRNEVTGKEIRYQVDPAHVFVTESHLQMFVPPFQAMKLTSVGAPTPLAQKYSQAQGEVEKPSISPAPTDSLAPIVQSTVPKHPPGTPIPKRHRLIRGFNLSPVDPPADLSTVSFHEKWEGDGLDDPRLGAIPVGSDGLVMENPPDVFLDDLQQLSRMIAAKKAAKDGEFAKAALRLWMGETAIRRRAGKSATDTLHDADYLLAIKKTFEERIEVLKELQNDPTQVEQWRVQSHPLWTEFKREKTWARKYSLLAGRLAKPRNSDDQAAAGIITRIFVGEARIRKIAGKAADAELTVQDYIEANLRYAAKVTGLGLNGCAGALENL